MADVVEITRRLSASPALGDHRPAFEVEPGRIDQLADGVCSVLADSPDAHLYARGADLLVRLVHGGHKPGPLRRESDAPLLVPVQRAGLVDLIERHCAFTRVTSKGEMRSVSCPPGLPDVILARAGAWPFPRVRGIAHVPLVHGDGSVTTSGYDADAGVVVVAPPGLSEFPRRPTDRQAMNALYRVTDAIDTFPFVGDEDRSVAVSLLKTSVLRPVLPTAPGFGIKAQTSGSGKSKMADVAAVIATGRTATAATWPPNPEEAEKRLGAAMMGGDPVLLLDNIESALKSPTLCSALTQESVAVRILGRSAMPRIETCFLLIATGNALVVAGDLTRRMLLCRLDPGVERPELRVFDFDPVERVREQREELVRALCTLAAWGTDVPQTIAPLGGFEEWSRRVRDPLIALGLPDPCICLEQLAEEDPEREMAVTLLHEWRRAFSDQFVSVSVAIRKATDLGQADERLREALDAVAGGPGGIQPRRLGKYLQKIRDRVYGQWVLRRDHDAVSNSACWAVRHAAAK